MTTIIVGAGASGIACAIRIKQNNPNVNVIIIERLATIGKKLLATGNGRCNLSNEASPYKEEVVSFFNKIGLVERADDEGRIYPYSSQATTVLEILEDECKRLGVEIITDCTVTGIDEDLCVTTDCGMYMADSIVIATGGMAQKALGSNGSGYELLKGIGHSITPLYPALVQLTSSSKYPRLIKGHRTKCNMKILLDGEIQAEEYGEVLFTDYGLSGIVTMNLSSVVSKNFCEKNPKKCHAVLDLAPDLSLNDISAHLKSFGSLKGILGSKLANAIEKHADGDKEKMAKYVKSWRLIITGTKGYDFAQITGGGADTSEFDNFESKKVKGVYACGEVLDEQFECGGFNLSFAFYSGIKVADKITNI